MRMRKRRNLTPRMEKCAAVLIETPEEHRGHWRMDFPGFARLHLELGCGKGRFTADTAAAAPDTLMVAVEKVPDAMILAMERICQRGLENVRFIDIDAVKLPELFQPGEVERIYINFCDPWPKSRDAKFRLTAPGFLRLYADALPLGGQIWFKTDNTPLFDWSIEQLTQEGWALSELTHDLHADGPVGVMTDYEAKFYAEGLKINRLVATKTADTITTAAGPVPRLHDAALIDARGYGESKETHRQMNVSHPVPTDFLDTAFLFSDELRLILDHTVEADPAKDWLPAYHFNICDPLGVKMGTCDLRIGHNEKTYYGGNIGYRIEEPYRGHHYAAKACRLLFCLARRHGLDHLIITCNPDNLSSRKACEALGGELLEIAELPETNDMRMELGETHKCIFRFAL